MAMLRGNAGGRTGPQCYPPAPALPEAPAFPAPPAPLGIEIAHPVAAHVATSPGYVHCTPDSAQLAALAGAAAGQHPSAAGAAEIHAASWQFQYVKHPAWA
jgi:hypothetical protein